MCLGGRLVRARFRRRVRGQPCKAEPVQGVLLRDEAPRVDQDREERARVAVRRAATVSPSPSPSPPPAAAAAAAGAGRPRRSSQTRSTPRRVARRAFMVTPEDRAEGRGQMRRRSRCAASLAVTRPRGRAPPRADAAAIVRIALSSVAAERRGVTKSARARRGRRE